MSRVVPLLVALLIPAALFANAPPNYATVAGALPELWSSRYPVEPVGFTANPENLGVLRAISEGRAVYYYHFLVELPRLERSPDESLSSSGSRNVELWVRYRAWLREPYDLTFVRRDLLPGTGRTWVRIP